MANLRLGSLAGKDQSPVFWCRGGRQQARPCDCSERWCPGQTSCGIWRRQAGISKAGGGSRGSSGVLEDLMSCLSNVPFKKTSYLISLGPVHPREDGPMPLFLVDPGLGPLSRLLNLVLHWDLVEPDLLLYQVEVLIHPDSLSVCSTDSGPYRKLPLGLSRAGGQRQAWRWILPIKMPAERSSEPLLCSSACNRQQPGFWCTGNSLSALNQLTRSLLSGHWHLTEARSRPPLIQIMARMFFENI